jgi:hypothetical protein
MITLHTLAAQLIARSAEPQPVLPPRDFEPHCLMSWRESVAGMDETAGFSKQQPCKTCSDHDEECEDIADKVNCWLYDPGRGMCPFLRKD